MRHDEAQHDEGSHRAANQTEDEVVVDGLTTAVQPRRLVPRMMPQRPTAVGCKRWLGGAYTAMKSRSALTPNAIAPQNPT